MEILVKLATSTGGEEIVRLDIDTYETDDDTFDGMEEDGSFVYFYDTEGILAAYPTQRVLGVLRA